MDSKAVSKESIGVGIIGAGGRGVRCLGFRMAESCLETGLRVAALCDRTPKALEDGRAALMERFGRRNVEIDPALHEEAEALIRDPRVDLIMITTPTHLHRGAAVPALRSGKKVYLDKPIAHTAEDAAAIAEEEARTANPLIMGFTRRYEAPWREMYRLVQEGVIGEVKMMQIRAIIDYWRYFKRWHRRRRWSGGALNDKSSHHFDVFNWFAASRAVKVNGFGGRSVFPPDEDAPKRCGECRRDCPYRGAASPEARPDEIAPAASSGEETEEQHRTDNCVYLPGADINDHATIHFAYENGVKASLMFCVFGPRAEDMETFELVGTKGRMILTRDTGTIDVIGEYGHRREVLDCTTTESASSHYGADLELLRELRRFCGGARPLVGAREGLEATRMVAAALRSIDRDGETVSMKDIPT